MQQYSNQEVIPSYFPYSYNFKGEQVKRPYPLPLAFVPREIIRIREIITVFDVKLPIHSGYQGGSQVD